MYSQFSLTKCIITSLTDSHGVYVTLSEVRISVDLCACVSKKVL